MTPERWKRLTELFEAALAQEPAARADFLAQAAADDPTLAQEVLRMLASDESASTFLKAPPGVGTLSLNDAPSASVAASEQQALARGNSLGRYIILEMIGSGGMGVVYAAYDPELDRKLAIKLLRPEASASIPGTDARARLLREAQAMARLSHNNVVNVHDVGAIGDEVFIAMEYVEGCTLKEWLEAEPRKWPDIVAMFVQAGRGLSSAHSAGIVHRDFKALNVLVGKDGRARVVDFGLARGSVGAEAAQTVQILPEELKAPSSGPKALASDLTKTGMLMGTPAYMAPEQIAGGPLDARTDQFSFCAALYHALYGEPPFEGDTLAERLAAITQGRLRIPKASTNVPGWLRQVVVKGLSSQSAARYSSMEVLLHKLQQNPAKVWRRVGAIAALALLAIATPWVSYRVVAHRQSLLCRGAQDKLAGIWDSARQEAIRIAFLSTAKPYANDAFKGVKRVLDTQAQAWVNMRTEACQATRLRGEQSEALLDLRMACLGSRLDEMRALAELFVQADAQVVEKSVDAANALTSLRGCADVAALTAKVKVPEDAATRAQVEKHQAALAEVKALLDVGKYGQGIERARQLVVEVPKTNYKPLEAQAVLMLGDLLTWKTEYKEAEKVLALAAIQSDSVGDDMGRARALIRLASVVGIGQTRMADGLRFAQQAGAVVERLGNPPELDSSLLATWGTILSVQGKNDEAVHRLKQALDSQQKAFGPGIRDTLVVAPLADALMELGKYEEALAYHRRAVQTIENTLGPEHPRLAIHLANIGIALRRQGKFDAALDAYRRALAINEKTYGLESRRVADVVMNIGAVLLAQGRYSEARALLQRAHTIREKTLGPEHGDLVDTLLNLGTASKEMGDLQASLAYYRRALAMATKVFGPEHPMVAKVLIGLSIVSRLEGDFPSSLLHLRRSITIQEKVLGAEHPDLSLALLHLGLTLHAQNERENFEMAVSALNRALAIREKATGPESPPVADVLSWLGVFESERKQKKGLVHLQRALDIREKTYPPGSSKIGLTLSQLGEAHLNLKQPLEAKPQLERAWKLLESSKEAPTALANTQFLLARALWDTNSDHERAIGLAQQARTVFLKAGKRNREDLRQVEAWLSSRLKPQAELSL